MLKELSYQQTVITGGFWKNRQDINREVTAQAVYQRFCDTHRFDALKCQPQPDWHPHFFWDSDVAKWIEGAAYLLGQNPDPALEAQVEAAIDDLIANQAPDGYMNSYFTVTPGETRFTDRDRHELYCAGHLIEAACAYYEATGKDRFLKAVCRFADLIRDIFMVCHSAPFTTGGHPEIELALIRLYKTTGEERYLNLARFFLEKRGNNKKDFPVNDWAKHYYDQSHAPLKQQRTAEGHAVRAMYTFCGVADLACIDQDKQYFEAAQAVFRNATEKRMYITGGLGSIHVGEAFTVDHDLPNDTAYAETCAALGMLMFARRMLRVEPDARYGDAIERVLYNGALSGVSMDGRSFFYVNPLELEPDFNDVNVATGDKIPRPITQRVEVFKCSCCPPNIFRVLASMSDLIYSQEDDTLFVHQFIPSTARVGDTVITQTTNYPMDGKITLTVQGKAFRRIAVRIPGWCQKLSFSHPHSTKKGYAYMDIPADGTVALCLDMPVELMEADAYIPADANKLAVMRGPVVYCVESVDNGGQLRNVVLDPTIPFTQEPDDRFGVPILKTKGLYKLPGVGLYRRFENIRQEKELTFIPYFAFANRGESEMYVWLNYRI